MPQENHQTHHDKTVEVLSSPKITTTHSKKLNILLAEDEETSALLISKTLKPYINRLYIAKNGKEAVKIFAENDDVNLILMDIKMPGMNGYEAAKLIREKNKDIIIIAQTAYALGGDRQKALDSGCNDYISKPISVMSCFI